MHVENECSLVFDKMVAWLLLISVTFVQKAKLPFYPPCATCAYHLQPTANPRTWHNVKLSVISLPPTLGGALFLWNRLCSHTLFPLTKIFGLFLSPLLGKLLPLLWLDDVWGWEWRGEKGEIIERMCKREVAYCSTRPLSHSIYLKRFIGLHVSCRSIIAG